MSGPVLILVGGGGHAKVLASALRRAGSPVHGIVDPRLTGEAFGVPVLGDDDALDAFGPAAAVLVNGIGSVGSNAARAALFARFKAKGYRFAQVVDPTALILDDVSLGEGCQVLAGAILQPGVVVGADTIVNTGARIDHDTILGAHVHVAPGATISGGVIVEDMVHIGAGAAIRQGVRLGRGAVVGVGAAVVADVPGDAVVVGVPAVARRQQGSKG